MRARLVGKGDLASSLDNLARVLGEDSTLSDLADMSEADAEFFSLLGQTDWFKAESRKREVARA